MVSVETSSSSYLHSTLVRFYAMTLKEKAIKKLNLHSTLVRFYAEKASAKDAMIVAFTFHTG